MAEKNDKTAEFDGFLMNLDAKIAALQHLRASYVAAVSVGAFGQPGDGSSFTVPLPSGPMGAHCHAESRYAN